MLPLPSLFFFLTFDDVSHESALADEPDAPGDVEHSGLDGEEDGDPLVVAVVEARPVVLPPRAHALEVGRNVERTGGLLTHGLNDVSIQNTGHPAYIDTLKLSLYGSVTQSDTFYYMMICILVIKCQ